MWINNKIILNWTEPYKNNFYCFQRTSAIEKSGRNTILENLNLVGPVSFETFGVPETPRPLIVHLLQELERQLKEYPGLGKRPWVINYLSGESILYEEIIAKIRR